MEPPQQPLPLVVDIHLAAYSGEIVLLSSFCPTAKLRRSVNVAEDAILITLEPLGHWTS